ncbi:MAG: PAS domain S-box protein [Thermoplasmatales archaeon]|nr:PAS domain S-box protein [Thermoplasmatales archaeon]
MIDKLFGLYQLSSQLMLANSSDELYETFSSILKNVFNFDAFELLIKEGNELKEAKVVGLFELPEPLLLNGNKGITVACTKEKKTIYVPDVSKDSRYIEGAKGMKSEVAVPIIYKDELIGVINVERKKINGFTDEDIKLLEIFSNILATAIKNLEIKNKLEGSERKYRSIFENSVEGIYRIKEGKLIEANKALEEFFGYSEEELKNMDLEELYRNPEDRKNFIEKLKKYGSVKNYEVEYLKKDGEIVIGNEYATLVREGNEEYVDGIIHDITSLKKAQEEAEFFNALLRHDVANKLQLIIGYLEIMMEEELKEEHREMIEAALNSALSASKIIDNVRKLQFLEKEWVKKDFDIDKFVEDLIKEYGKDARERNINIEHEKYGKKIFSTELIGEVISNLLGNAIYHSKAKNIKIGVSDEGKEIKIYVRDDGIGISEELKKNLFKMGAKGKESRGSGLGLYLSKRIVEKMGGRIEVRDAVKEGKNKGTIFEIYLPK